MRIEISGRVSGKSTRIAEWIKEEPQSRAVVVYSYDEKERFMREFELNDSQVITIMEAKLSKGVRDVEVWIDELEICLNTLLGNYNLAGVSISDGGDSNES